MSQKLILVLGATGAQGQGVIDGLLAPTTDGQPSPYAVRALTRNPSSARAQELAKKGCEVMQGSVDKLDTVRSALEGCYGAWVNTDGFTLGEAGEVFAGMRIFEIAKQTKSLRHFIWSNLDYGFKKGNYEERYHCDHFDGKGRVGEWLKAQPSSTGDTGLTWTVVTSGLYMQMLHSPLFGPLNKRSDGTFVFAAPLGQGHVTMIALEDLGWWARHVFEHRVETSGKDLEIASDVVDWDQLVSTFKAVTGQKAVYKPLDIDEWMNLFDGTNLPVASGRAIRDGSTTWREDFAAFYALWRDDIMPRDLAWIRSVHPESYTLERWMREKNYTGEWKPLLKNIEEGHTVTPKMDLISQL